MGTLATLVFPLGYIPRFRGFGRRSDPFETRINGSISIVGPPALSETEIDPIPGLAPSVSRDIGITDPAMRRIELAPAYRPAKGGHTHLRSALQLASTGSAVDEIGGSHSFIASQFDTSPSLTSNSFATSV